ncbi:hypothetical protein EDB92DRAFT_1886300 [Lactarius akahatsu]|uniref:Uncharacterized protein n=1 Tax=Lactarius akahatsu TaxID=416441 RepID=A0AAD4LDS6_9AGAM|nr:hypothetical protein EDB92DRAFT_1886300 [Lactarius akahatsu]
MRRCFHFSRLFLGSVRTARSSVHNSYTTSARTTMKTYRLPHHLHPLPLRAFARTKCTALHVLALFTDVPLKVLPEHERKFRTFARKVIWGAGAVACMQGAMTVGVRLRVCRLSSAMLMVIEEGRWCWQVRRLGSGSSYNYKQLHRVISE